ncbi:hypothetical protein ScPMuIL_016765 [Solemya velum]
MDSTRLCVLMAVLVPLFLSSTAVNYDTCPQVLRDCVFIIRRHAPGREFVKCARIAERCYQRYKKKFQEKFKPGF